MASNGILAGLDLGTTRTTAIVAEPTEDGSLRILGWGVADRSSTDNSPAARAGRVIFKDWP